MKLKKDISISNEWKEDKRKRRIKRDIIEINKKIYNFNNKSSSKFYKVDKNLNNINQKNQKSSLNYKYFW